MGLDMYLTARKGSEEPIQIGYWRKANAIHNWMVTKVQNNVDDCSRYELSFENIIDLFSICKGILNNNFLPDELPTVDGFFFGSTEIDEYYYKSLKNTIDFLSLALEHQRNGYIIEYQSCW